VNAAKIGSRRLVRIKVGKPNVVASTSAAIRPARVVPSQRRASRAVQPSISAQASSPGTCCSQLMGPFVKRATTATTQVSIGGLLK
jgi:hypothetical protein